jgi:hypothetical protein
MIVRGVDSPRGRSGISELVIPVLVATSRGLQPNSVIWFTSAFASSRTRADSISPRGPQRQAAMGPSPVSQPGDGAFIFDTAVARQPHRISSALRHGGPTVDRTSQRQDRRRHIGVGKPALQNAYDVGSASTNAFTARGCCCSAAHQCRGAAGGFCVDVHPGEQSLMASTLPVCGHHNGGSARG